MYDSWFMHFLYVFLLLFWWFFFDKWMFVLLWLFFARFRCDDSDVVALCLLLMFCFFCACGWYLCWHVFASFCCTIVWRLHTLAYTRLVLSQKNAWYKLFDQNFARGFHGVKAFPSPWACKRNISQQYQMYESQKPQRHCLKAKWLCGLPSAFVLTIIQAGDVSTLPASTL